MANFTSSKINNRNMPNTPGIIMHMSDKVVIVFEMLAKKTKSAYIPVSLRVSNIPDRIKLKVNFPYFTQVVTG